jgi:hypothetical protein
MADRHQPAQLRYAQEQIQIATAAGIAGSFHAADNEINQIGLPSWV